MKLSNWWPLGLIPVFWLLLWLWSGAAGREAVLKQQIRARDKTIAALAIQKAKVDTVHAQAVAVYLPAKTHWDSVKVVLKDPVAIVAVADTTIKKCEAVVLSCAGQVAIRDTIIWQKDSLLADVKARQPGWLRRNFGCAIGLAGTPKGFGPGAACGKSF